MPRRHLLRILITLALVALAIYFLFLRFPSALADQTSPTSVTISTTTSTSTTIPTTTTLKVNPAKVAPHRAPATEVGGSICHGRKAPDEPKAFIYFCESGNNPGSINKGGCRGLGQACPGSKLPCSSSDYDCQDKWFTNYCFARYGSWEKAKAFWLGHNYW